MMNLSTASKIKASLFIGMAGTAICAIFSFTSGQPISGVISAIVFVALFFTICQLRKLISLIEKSNAILKAAAQGGDLNTRIIGISDSGVINRDVTTASRRFCTIAIGIISRIFAFTCR